MKRSLSLSLLSAMLSATVLASVAYIYSCGDTSVFLLMTLFAVIYTAIIFPICEFLKKKNKVIISVAVLAVMVICVGALAGRFNELRVFSDYLRWFMDPQKFSRIYTGSIMSLILMFGIVLDTAMFYFTRIQFRAAYIFLICMCPFSLFAKTFTDIPVLYTVIVTTLFFTLIMFSSSSKNSGTTNTVGFDISKVLTLVCFVSVITVISAFFPKFEYAPYREEFDELITGIKIGAEDTGNYNDFSQSSSTLSASDDEKKKVLYRIYGEAPRYIKRQCFNYYNGAETRWEYYGDENTGNANWRRFTYFEDPKVFYDAMDYNGGETYERECVIVSSSERLRALYTHENTLNISFKEDEDFKVYRTELGEYFLANNLDSYPRSYQLKWADFTPEKEFSELFTDLRAKQIVNSENETAGYAAIAYITAKEEAKKHDDYLLAEYVRKSCYKSERGYDEVKRLTEEITSNCKSDLEKAVALERYFHTNKFAYDENFSTSDTSPDNFILNTRRGICTDYATAMTLMCREAGLTARYVEGFLLGEFNEAENCYILTVGDAHAYVQVWIDGYGWTDFDPTSGNIDGGYNTATFLFIGITAVLITIIAVLLMLMIPRIKRSAFLSRLGKMNTRASFISAYEYINAEYNSFIGTKRNSLTPTELAENSASMLGYNIDGFIAEYEKCVYGNINCGSASECVRVCKEYFAHKRLAEKQRRKARKAAKKKRR